MNEKIPPIDSLIGKNEWKGISTDNARFELFLMQLGKTNVTTVHFQQFFGRPHMAIKPNTFKIFFYSLEQMDDKNRTRSHSFRQGLQRFMRVRNPLPPFGRENHNHFVGHKGHKETVDICNPQFLQLRDKLVAQARKTADWIRNYFMTSPDVIVANKGHLLDLLEGWDSDPCLRKRKG